MDVDLNAQVARYGAPCRVRCRARCELQAWLQAMQVLISPSRPSLALSTRKGSARKGRAMDTMSAWPCASTWSGLGLGLELGLGPGLGLELVPEWPCTNTCSGAWEG